MGHKASSQPLRRSMFIQFGALAAVLALLLAACGGGDQSEEKACSTSDEVG